jgi:uncharacterized protein with von Willebrand factor type A (vWA) domain
MTMSSTALKKAATPVAYPAATGLFEQLASLFASPSSNNKLKLAPSQLDASLKALQHAPFDELAAVSEILQEISARVFKLNENSNRINRERQEIKTSVAAEQANHQDSVVHDLLARAREQAVEAELTTEQDHANAEVMSRLRRESAVALQQRIDSKELLPPKEFQAALGISRQSINEAVKARRMFALLGPAGEYYYPAFYADGDLNRREVEKVAKMLGRVPAASKYHFFTSKSIFLGAVTPLQALKKGRLEDVLIAAAAFQER